MADQENVKIHQEYSKEMEEIKHSMFKYSADAISGHDNEAVPLLNVLKLIREKNIQINSK